MSTMNHISKLDINKGVCLRYGEGIGVALHKEKYIQTFPYRPQWYVDLGQGNQGSTTTE